MFLVGEGGLATMSYCSRCIHFHSVAGLDFIGISEETVTFGLNDTHKRVQVPIINDSLRERRETFFVSISSSSRNVTHTASKATIEIPYNDCKFDTIVLVASVTESPSIQADHLDHIILCR